MKQVENLKEALSHVLWIGGATDAGKTTTAQTLVERHDCNVYHYDNGDLLHLGILTKKDERILQFWRASLDERWVDTTPEELLAFLQDVYFPLRFELIIEELLEIDSENLLVVEGFGLLPEFVQPLLSHPNQAIWFVPTDKFKRESMERRGKPSFAPRTRDPEQAKHNLLTRDMMLAAHIREQVAKLDLHLHETDGTLSIDATTNIIEDHFEQYLDTLDE